MVKRLTVFGSTGSIGTQALDVVATNPVDFEIVALGAGRNWSLLAQQALKFRPAAVALRDEKGYASLKEALASLSSTEIFVGPSAFMDVLEFETDIVLGAVTGIEGLASSLGAVERGYDLALANKESLVCGGHLIKEAACRSGASLIPVDSEHSAVWQLWDEAQQKKIKKVILTASGGALRDRPLEDLQNISVSEALTHPTWTMGQKITIDSATLMNKALEIIEAHVLFDLPYENLEAIMHPQSIIHALVGYEDGSYLAHLGVSDMRIPIAYALYGRMRHDVGVPLLDLLSLPNGLTFRPLEAQRYPLFFETLKAVQQDRSVTTVINGANEVAVYGFLDGKIKFLSISQLVRQVSELFFAQAGRKEFQTVADIFYWDQWARQKTEELMNRI